MKPRTYRRIGLVAPLALLGLAFFLSSVYGQRPPIPHMPKPPHIPKPPAFNPNPNPNPGIGPRIHNPGMGGHIIERIWTCSGCGKEVARNTAFPPSTCPHCGARLINGIGPPNPSVSNPPMMPMNPPTMPLGQPPAFNPNPNPGMPNFDTSPIPNPVMPGVNPNPNPGPSPTPPPAASPTSSTAGSDPGSSSSTPSKSRFNGKVIALVVGIVVLGIFALLGGTFLMIYTMKSGSEAPARRRRRPRRYEDEYDD